MKANAPERIWVHEQSAMELNVPLKEYHVEYIRSDAFIEKACKFIKDNGSRYIDIVNGQLILKKGIIKDFRKYMKGK